MIRKHKNYSRPKKPFELGRIKDENILLAKYGLKNKREIWKTTAKVNYFRHRAMDLSDSPQEEKNILFNKLKNIGLNVSSTADVLALTIEDLLNRRLQTIVFKKAHASSIKQARQFITHRKVLINNKVNNVPGYIVSIEEEKNLSIKPLKLNKKEQNESNVEVKN